MASRIAIIACLLVLGVGATGIDSGEVTLATDQRQYHPHDTAHLILFNGSEEDFSYSSLCWATLERKEGDEWKSVACCGMGACNRAVYTLPPGRKTTYSKPLNDAVTPGTYRFGIGGMVRYYTEPFEVSSR